MSEEVKTEDKQTNRVFDQSDFDKMVSKKEKEIADKYADYETLKQKAETFEKLKLEQEQAKLSEVEKANQKAKELEDKLIRIETEKKTLEKKTLKLEVLSNPKYSSLPNPFKIVVDGETIEELTESAEKSLKEFEEVLKNAGKQTNMGLPPPPTKVESKPVSLSDAFQERLTRR
jgi:DNA repair exonuclease SbcCD ATPase subunit